MVKVTVVCVGKLKEAFWRDAVAEYAKRLSRFCKFEVRELAEGRTIEEEADPILRACKGYVFALAVEGEECSSETFSAKLRSLAARGEEIVFVIGSSCGLSERVKRAANERLSFSRMTLPHQLMRVVLCEQIYRAYMINSGSEYHK